MTSLIEKDFFTDPDILVDPYAYFEEVRKHGPIYQPPGKDYLIVTGFSEALEIFRNSTDFSSSIALQGAAYPLAFEPSFIVRGLSELSVKLTSAQALVDW